MKTDATIDRLRAANPVPSAERVEDPELFARITAAAPDLRLRRRSRFYGRRRLVIALALLAAALLASTAFAVSQLIGANIVKPPVTRSEYRAAQHELALPPGYSWPPAHVPSNSVTGRGAGGGTAVTIAQNAWECYWVKAIGDGDRAAQRRAQAELEQLVEKHMIVAPAGAPEDWTPPNPPPGPYAIFADDGGLAWIVAGYRMAAHGDPARIAASCRANAPGVDPTP
ncbi:MAG TPA: hypothetical protein VE570_07885 [Thermoleophilaceae bacterium]|nr:hypothetical protein [Thermoleophilaceae bacterium]